MNWYHTRFTAQEFLDAGVTLQELRDAGFTAGELRADGLTARQCLDAGFGTRDLNILNDAGFVLREIAAVGMSPMYSIANVICLRLAGCCRL